MTKLVMVAVLAAVVAAFLAMLGTRSAADASGAGDPRIAVLQRQVKLLQAQVKALQVQGKRLSSEVADTNDQLQVNFEGDTCLGAVNADLIQGTWGVIDQIATTAQQKTYFGPQTQVSDYKNCADLANPDVPRGAITVPPTINPLLPLLQWLHE
jgi:hypothetical protein